MILRSVELENFGRFQNKSIEFRRGMNLVIGPNEAGKSTIAEAVPAILYGTDHPEKYKPWGRNICSAGLFFEGGGRTIEIKRNLISDEVSLVEKDDLYHTLSSFSGRVPLRGRSRLCREYRDLLESLLGVGDEELFRATYFFGHHPKEWKGDELAHNLRALVSSSTQTDYAEILDSLFEEHFSLTSENPWGRDKQRDREYEILCHEISQSEPVESVPVFVEIDEYSELDEQIKTLSDELLIDKLELEKGIRYVEHLHQKCQDNQSSLSNKGADTPSNSAPNYQHDLCKQLVEAGLPETPPKELSELLNEASDIRQKMSELQQPYATLARREKNIPKIPWRLSLLVIFFVVLAASLVWWQKWHHNLIALFAGLATFCTLAWCGWKTVTNRKIRSACDRERNRLDQKKMLVQKRQFELTERCERYGLPSSPVDLVRMQKAAAENNALLEAFWSHSDQSCSETGQEAPKNDDAVKEHHLPQDQEEHNPDNNLKELEERIEAFKLQINQKEERLQELQNQSNQQSPANRSEIHSRTALHYRKGEIEHRIRVLRQAINLLADAVEEFSRSHLVGLNAEASKIFSRSTTGRYTKIRLDKNMTPSVLVGNRRWIAAESLSRGTIDVLYIVLRTALSKVRNDGRSLPLMLDDPFVHLDAKRLAKILNIIDVASANGQMVLFSHNLELGKRAARERWHVVSLDLEDHETSNEEEGVKYDEQLHLL